MIIQLQLNSHHYHLLAKLLNRLLKRTKLYRNRKRKTWRHQSTNLPKKVMPSCQHIGDPHRPIEERWFRNFSILMLENFRRWHFLSSLKYHLGKRMVFSIPYSFSYSARYFHFKLFSYPESRTEEKRNCLNLIRNLLHFPAYKYLQKNLVITLCSISGFTYDLVSTHKDIKQI